MSRLTGYKEHFTKEEVTSFFLKAIEETDRYFFLILDPNGKIIGESVINQLPSTEVGGLRLTSVVQTNSPERVLPYPSPKAYAVASQASLADLRCFRRLINYGRTARVRTALICLFL